MGLFSPARHYITFAGRYNPWKSLLQHTIRSSGLNAGLIPVDQSLGPPRAAARFPTRMVGTIGHFQPVVLVPTRTGPRAIPQHELTASKTHKVALLRNASSGRYATLWGCISESIL